MEIPSIGKNLGDTVGSATDMLGNAPSHACRKLGSDDRYKKRRILQTSLPSGKFFMVACRGKFIAESYLVECPSGGSFVTSLVQSE
jgi:hypothetical protein